MGLVIRAKKNNCNDNNDFRFLTTFNKSAKINMAIDRVIAKNFKSNDKPILRFYTWENSFTVGASQNLLAYAKRYPKYNNNYAKRMTGGGTLFHGHDLSYSVVFPTMYLKGLSVKESYEKICSFLLVFYKKIGFDAQYAKDIENITLSKSEFCQVGFEAYDIIINGIKIGGNAQKRSKNMIFQHGSIPLKSVNNCSEVGYSLEDLGKSLSYEEAIKELKLSFIETFNVQLNDSSLDEKENICLKQLLEN